MSTAVQEDHLGSDCVLSSLRHLDLSSAGIKDLGTVFAAQGPLAALTGLVLDSNHLTSLAPLAGLTRLVHVSVNNNNHKPGDGSSSSSASSNSLGSFCFAAPLAPGDVSGSAGSAPRDFGRPLLPSLRTLQLAGNGLTSLVPLQLQCLPALCSLFVQNNELSRLDGLEGMVQLRELVADRNRLRCAGAIRNGWWLLGCRAYNHKIIQLQAAQADLSRMVRQAHQAM